MLPSLNTLKLPDPWQHQAVNLLREGTDVVVSAPTGAGKTYIFELLHQSRSLLGQAVYTVPTRALANDKFAEWKEAKWDVGIATGDVSENVGAPVVVATLETQLERLVRGEGPALLVIDEYQMIADATRGSHYEAAIALAPAGTRLLLLSGSVANPEDVVAWLRRLGRAAEVVQTKERPVPLEEAPWEALPQRMARHFEHFWPKFAAAVMLADLAPLLIFSPRRKEAESIARRLAADLPAGDSLELTHEQRAVCGKDLTALLEKRIAFHHSGLSYAARAGVIEPLAKAGQLRVIVATMGLSAGINFSVRSVHVAATTFHDGKGEHKLTPAELLQMYGRAGRRGLDEKGYVVTTRQSPTLMDARPARLHRGELLAWPIFLRVMKHASQTGADTFEAAGLFASRLFAKTPPLLGLEADAPEMLNAPQAVKALFGLEATQKQILNSQGEWERRTNIPLQRMPLGQAWLAGPEKSALALSVPGFVARFAHGIGRVGKLGKDRYGVEIPLGQPLEEEPGHLRPTKSLRKLLKLPRKVESVPLEEIEILHSPALAALLLEGQNGDVFPEVMPRLTGTAAKEGLVFAIFDLGEVEVPVYHDSHARPILQPRERTIVVKNETGIHTDDSATTATDRQPRPGSPIHAWRSLGLIDEGGVPTRRGEIFSFFQGGEGLAIAAALEDESYPVDELIPHMANLRSGTKFDLPVACGSERLGAICRNTFGFINHPGYLENGLPLDYGEGAAELLDTLLHPDRPGSRDLRQDVAAGDLSRAYVEWLSLLRHITHAPAHPWRRWLALQEAATSALKQHNKTLRHLFHLDLPPLTNKQRHGKPKHYLMVRG
ncbi:DEAD/DEAH box helicase [Prosthecobacter sp. SYSU 5D2]|uniref:DEAD/DEAH box helicase n=1 Tax=Prosthecobacter sp. SYSU 5D2 TaxID=3134134 RepID=UPI0031FE97E7